MPATRPLNRSSDLLVDNSDESLLFAVVKVNGYPLGAEVKNALSDKIARPQLTVDCKIEHRDLPNLRRELSTAADSGDFPNLYQSSLIPQYPPVGLNRSQDAALSTERDQSALITFATMSDPIQGVM